MRYSTYVWLHILTSDVILPQVSQPVQVPLQHQRQSELDPLLNAHKENRRLPCQLLAQAILPTEKHHPRMRMKTRPHLHPKTRTTRKLLCSFQSGPP